MSTSNIRISVAVTTRVRWISVVPCALDCRKQASEVIATPRNQPKHHVLRTLRPTAGLGLLRLSRLGGIGISNQAATGQSERRPQESYAYNERKKSRIVCFSAGDS